MGRDSRIGESADSVGLFLEEVCFNLCLMGHARNDGIDPDRLEIHQEVDLLRDNDSFADLKVTLPDRSYYFLEVKFFYSAQRLLTSLHRKYGRDSASAAGAAKLILVIDTECYPDWTDLLQRLIDGLHPDLTLEIWDEPEVRRRIKDTLRVEIDDIRGDRIQQIRDAIHQAKGKAAFGAKWNEDSLQKTLLWHFGVWRLNQLHLEANLEPRDILPPGPYKDVVVMIADLCAFSSYVRDTRDTAVVSHCLTSFYSKARYEIINAGGMLYLYVGDAVIAFFGLPKNSANILGDAMACAEALIDVGKSVSREWQRKIDRKQEKHGIHIGMAIGDVDIVPLQPFDAANLGAVSDSINMASRLLETAGPDEIVVSNTFYRRLAANRQKVFVELAEVNAKNLGRILSWKWAPRGSRADHRPEG